MNKFWEWMLSKNYARLTSDSEEDFYKYSLVDKDDINVAWTKQMLIGYMIEYLQDKKISCNIDGNNIFKYVEYNIWILEPDYNVT